MSSVQSLLRLVTIAWMLMPFAALAQMGGGRGSMMSGQAGSNMMSGPTIGPDGSVYVLRRAAANSSQGMMSSTGTTLKSELVAISPVTGKVSWTVQFDGVMVSEPVFSKDGLTLFLTVSQGGMYWNTSLPKPALVIIANSSTSGRVQNRVDIDADVVSEPRLTPDGQTVYISAWDMDTASGTLYAFSVSGALKFKIDLGQGQMMMGPR